MYCSHARLCVCVSACLSAAVRPHYCTDPDVTWGRGRSCPLVVHYWVDLQSVHGLCCYGNIMRNLVFAGCACVADCGWWGRSQNCAPYITSARGWLAGDWPSTGWGGCSQHYCGGLDPGFHWWRSGDITRTQNVSEYMLVLQWITPFWGPCRSKSAMAGSSILLPSWSRRSCWSGAHCHCVSLITASVNGPVIRSVLWQTYWRRMALTVQAVKSLLLRQVGIFSGVPVHNDFRWRVSACISHVDGTI